MIWCYVFIFGKTQKKREVENVIKKHAKRADTELNEEERADFLCNIYIIIRPAQTNIDYLLNKTQHILRIKCAYISVADFYNNID